MTARLSRLLKSAFTLTLFAIALAVGWNLWQGYMETPWTRDGHVRADVVSIAPDISGPVAEVLVSDNQTVAKGEVLVRIDPARFQIALALADASLKDRAAALTQARREAERYHRLENGPAVSQQNIEQADLAVEQASAAYDEAKANRDLAALNLERTSVRAPANGVISNLSLNPGDYVASGSGVMALIDTDTLRVEGYFEENQLPRIAVGDAVSVDLMGHGRKLRGHVESIAAGIEDRERTNGSNLLANVTPTFAWVRLAQRVPVRIALDEVPAGTRLVAGLTATVTVYPGNGQAGTNQAGIGRAGPSDEAAAEPVAGASGS
ncbi:HlyD family secretion protein [Aurantimonas sp. 22II-16-19i]|uniref:efflux RND transporter periplasmic adaptor subunit n=1 Tax=Aurantimonas sp. 22II-16-19i TaxID=1317114 RepID=UPI0009F7E10F|nr:HlyD family secretion protein [Aurantimonas sp. 22II-16-19i]ORE88193.1 RND family efflux transporter MFP subunit [Aurantimonas sp. 22II-16-19i]